MNRRARRRAALALAAAALGAAAWAFKPFDRWRASEAWEKGTAAVRQGDFNAAYAAFNDCLNRRPDRADCAAGQILLSRAVEAEQKAAAAASEALAAKRESELDRLVARLSESRAAEDPPGRPVDRGAVVEVRGRRAPEVSEEDQRRAIKHWNEGIKAFQKGDMTAARDHWTLCGKFDPANEECVQGLTRLARTYGEGL